MRGHLLAGVALALALNLGSLRAQGTFVYDQQSVTNDAAGGEGSPAIQLNAPVGQSFTPALASIGFVRLHVFDANRNNGLGVTLAVNLRAGAIDGAILASSESVFLPDNFGGATNVTFFFPSNPSLAPGATYFLEPVVQSGDLWQISDDNKFGYGGGTAFLSGAAVSGFDLWFREGIIVPEPSWTALFGLALAGWFVRRCRKSCQCCNEGNA